MKIENNLIDYGVYIDRKVSYIISLNHVIHEELMDEEIEENAGVLPRTTKINGQQGHLQNTRNEQLKKFCKTIISKLVNAHSILVFGPSEAKFELQKEIRDNKSLKNVKEELMVTDVLNKEGALHFVKDHFKTITMGQQTFVAAKKD